MKNKYGPQRRWAEKNLRQFTIRLACKSDADIIEVLDRQENKTDFIRQAIKNWIAAKGAKTKPVGVGFSAKLEKVDLPEGTYVSVDNGPTRFMPSPEIGKVEEL